MTNYERLLELEKQDNTEILARDFRDNEYVINSTVKGEVALFHVNYADGSKDKLISKEDFNSNYTIISYWQYNDNMLQ